MKPNYHVQLPEVFVMVFVPPRPLAQLRKPHIIISAGWLDSSQPQSLEAWLGILHA